ncbi:MAG: MmcQ/YjbR family DNA-binding protein [Thermomicrobiales bacterium]
MPEHPHHDPHDPLDETIMQRMREICDPLPEAVEAEVFGAPTFQVRTKNFAMLRRSEQGASVWCKAAPGVQDEFIMRDPAHYFAPPYVGPKGWIGAWLDEDVDPDWDEIADIVVTSYRLVAPKRLVAVFDQQ